MTKPTPKQIQQACDLANATHRGNLLWRSEDYGQASIVTALADTIAESAAKDALIAAEKARADKAVADLREIADITKACGWHHSGGSCGKVANIANPYRVETAIDPDVLAVRATLHAHQRAMTPPDSGWGDMSYIKGSYDHLPVFETALAAYKAELAKLR